MKLPTTYPVSCHTDNVQEGGTFVAIPGTNYDGTIYIPSALAKGARRIVVEDSANLSLSIKEAISQACVELMRVPNARKALAELSAEALDYPARKLFIIGITGTKGKTTTAFLLEHILAYAGKKTALLSSVYNKINGAIFPAPLTTAQPDYLHVFLDQCVKQQVDCVVMEVAAQAVSLHRVDGISFDALIFTNFAQEHGEFYPTLDDYFAAKKALLNSLKPHAPLFINSDDQRTASLVASHSPVISFSLQKPADYQAQFCAEQQTISLEWCYQGMSLPKITSSTLLGMFNAYNMLAVAAVSHWIKIPGEIIQQAFASFKSVPGRLEKYRLPNGATAYIDYAHNPSSFEALFKAVRSLSRQLIVVFGAGGGKDHAKRPVMGEVAARFADHIILTNDNPRNEDPQLIVDSIREGVPAVLDHKVTVELNREYAIKLAYTYSDKDTIILLLGKGPQEYQIEKGIKKYFSERMVLQQLGV